MSTFIIANWKMQKTHNESIAWVNEYAHELDEVVKQSQNTLVLCPSFTPLQSISAQLKNTTIAVGAQDCCAFERGAYTGEVSVLSLQEIGCTYCLVGHSDRRHYHGETDCCVAQKALLLLKHNISPIVCIGESADARANKKTYSWLCKQLKPLLNEIGDVETQARLFIAYEPLWAIGTGHIPTQEELYEVSAWIKDIVSACLSVKTHILYGGSVDDAVRPNLHELSSIDGFLVGRASTKIEVLKSIVAGV